MSTPDDFRRIALGLPKAYEDTHRRRAAFRVEARIFGLLGADGPSSLFDGLESRQVAVVKLEREHQLNLAAAYPDAVRPAETYGHHGWTYVTLDRIEAADLETVVYFAWANVAPKRVRDLLGVGQS
jgi:hypothetical protein